MAMRPAGSIVLMRGLPASGKSTAAREIRTGIRARGEQCLILSRDAIRDALGCG